MGRRLESRRSIVSYGPVQQRLQHNLHAIEEFMAIGIQARPGSGHPRQQAGHAVPQDPVIVPADMARATGGIGQPGRRIVAAVLAAIEPEQLRQFAPDARLKRRPGIEFAPARIEGRAAP